VQLRNKQLIAQAISAENAARSTADPIIKSECLKLAHALREIATGKSNLSILSDTDVEGLVERMIGHGTTKL
jgi:hypothetical protein